MIRHEVSYGEWMAKIAADYGSTVSAIWKAPENAELRQRRGSPSELYPGDVLWIPVADSGAGSTSTEPPGPLSGGASHRPYVIQPGDYLARLAFVLRFDADDVWDHPLNAVLKATRNPDVLFPGDILWVPTGSTPTARVLAKASNAYVAARPMSTIIVRFLHGEEPWANTPVTVSGLGPSATVPTHTTGDGKLTLEVPITTPTVDVLLGEGETAELFTLLIGHLDPVTTLSGLWARLTGLGYLDGIDDELQDLEAALEGDDADLLVAAVRAFQRHVGLDVDGVPSPPVLARLVEAYGS